MKVLVLGATGGMGQLVVAQALEQSHTVSVLVRHPERLQNTKEIRVMAGNVLADPQKLAEALLGQDVVISALGVGNSLKSRGLVSHTAPLLVSAMARQRIRRLIFVSAYGVGSTRRYVPLFPRILTGLLLSDIYADKQAGENFIFQSDLDWTIVYPVTLTNGPRTTRYQVGEHLVLRGFPKISRADVAHFLVSQIGDTQYSRKGVLIGP
jgi:putative NADH-flavin reductase